MNRPTRVPSPPPSHGHHPDQFVDEQPDVMVLEQPINHAPPAVRKEPEIPSADDISERISVDLPKTSFGKVVEAIANVMAEIKPVEKLGWNKFHGYAHARIGDLNAELTPLMGKHGLVVFQNEVGRDMFDNGAVVGIRYEFTVVHKSGEIWFERPVITGVARCRTQKESFDDKTFNKCHTAARKYFLISLFQIPVEDADDADGSVGSEATGGQARQVSRPPGRRQVPSPDGKVPPHLIPILEGDQPADWVKKFGAFIAKVATKAEIDRWYEANAQQFEKLKKADENAYNSALDLMDDREAAITAADPISSGKQEAAAKPDAGGFPGDTKMVTKPIDLSIPFALDAKVTEPEKDWLRALDEAYKECHDAESLAAEQESTMMPSQGTASERAWAHAVKLTQTHLDRIQGT